VTTSPPELRKDAPGRWLGSVLVGVHVIGLIVVVYLLTRL